MIAEDNLVFYPGDTGYVKESICPSDEISLLIDQVEEYLVGLFGRGDGLPDQLDVLRTVVWINRIAQQTGMSVPLSSYCLVE